MMKRLKFNIAVFFSLFFYISLPVGELRGQAIHLQNNLEISGQSSTSHYVEPMLVICPKHSKHFLIASMVIRDVAAWKPEVHVWNTRDAGKTWGLKRFPKLSADPWLTYKGDHSFTLTGLGHSLKGDYNEYMYISNDGGNNWDSEIAINESHDHPFSLSLNGELIWWSTTRSNRVLNLKKLNREEQLINIDYIDFKNGLRHDNMIPATHPSGLALFPYSRYESSFNEIKTHGSFFLAMNEEFHVLENTFITDRNGAGKGIASLHADHSDSRTRGNLYYVYAMGDFGESKGIGISLSKDLGNEWIHKTVAETSKNKLLYLPTAAISNEGVIALFWIEIERSLKGLRHAVYFSFSSDGAESFSKPLLLDNYTHFSRINKKHSRVYNTFPAGGHYSGMSALADGSFQLVWSDPRTGFYKLYTANVTIDSMR